MIPTLQTYTHQQIFAFGYDAEMNGANQINCHFSIFSSKGNTEVWDAGKRQAQKDRQVLSPIELELLRYLMTRPGYHLASKINIIGCEDPKAVAVYILRIRRKIGTGRIKTKKGFGYCYNTEAAE